MSIEIKLNTFSFEGLLNKLRDFIRPFDEDNCSEDKILKSLGAGCLVTYGMILSAIIRYRNNLSADAIEARTVFAIASIPVFAAALYRPKNLIYVLLGALAGNVVKIADC